MRKALSKIGGYDVTVTEDVQLVLRLARTAEVDLVVMDVSLANSLFEGNQMDGLAITRLLKADALARRVPVLLATAYAMQGDSARLIGASGADDYISKPFVEPRELVDKVRSLLARDGAADSNGHAPS